MQRSMRKRLRQPTSFSFRWGILRSPKLPRSHEDLPRESGAALTLATAVHITEATRGPGFRVSRRLLLLSLRHHFPRPGHGGVNNGSIFGEHGRFRTALRHGAFLP